MRPFISTFASERQFVRSQVMPMPWNELALAGPWAARTGDGSILEYAHRNVVRLLNVISLKFIESQLCCWDGGVFRRKLLETPDGGDVAYFLAAVQCSPVRMVGSSWISQENLLTILAFPGQFHIHGDQEHNSSRPSAVCGVCPAIITRSTRK